jgi:hypothetical protein
MKESIILSPTIKHTHIYIFPCIYAASYIVISKIKRLVVCVCESSIFKYRCLREYVCVQ